MEIPVTSVQPLAEYLRLRGLPDIFFQDLQDQTFLNLESYRSLINRGLMALGDPFLGIHYGMYLNLRALGIIYQVSLQCETIAQGISYLEEYLIVAFPPLGLESETRQHESTLRLRIDPDWQAEDPNSLHHSAISTLILMLREMQYMLGEASSEIELSVPSPPSEQSYLQAQLKVPVRTSPYYELHVPDARLRQPLHPRLGIQLDSVLMAYQAVLLDLKAHEGQFSDQVKLLLINLLGQDKAPVLETVCMHFTLSRRTLQRKLQESGYTFRDLLDELRRQLSQRMLTHSQLSIGDIAYYLGYAEASAFIRAYQRWFGKSPHAARRTG